MPRRALAPGPPWRQVPFDFGRKSVASALELIEFCLADGRIYGVFAYSVGERKREIGVRLALGAVPVRIIGQFVASGGRLIAAGVGLGLAAAVLLTRFQAALLYGVEPVDLRTFALVTIILSGAAVIGVLVPARRASRIEPMRVLREE